MSEDYPTLPFSTAEFRAALELFGPVEGSEDQARQFSEMISAAEAARERRGGNLTGPVEQEGSSYRHAAFPSIAISPDLLMMLSLVNPILEAKVRSYMAESRLITGPLAERWEAQRERLKEALASNKERLGP